MDLMHVRHNLKLFPSAAGFLYRYFLQQELARRKYSYL